MFSFRILSLYFPNRKPILRGILNQYCINNQDRCQLVLIENLLMNDGRLPFLVQRHKISLVA